MLGFLWQLFQLLFRWRLVQVPPNKAAVITTPKATRILRQGTTWVKEPIERFQGYIDLNQVQIDLDIKGAYTKLFVPVSVKAVALTKVKGDDEGIKRAAERYLGIPPERTKNQVQETLIGHLRSILATMTIEQINADRQALVERTSHEAEADLNKMGIEIDALTIQHVIDEHHHLKDTELGYMDALGQKSLAEARRNALVETAKAEAEIAKARRDTDLLKLQYEADVAEAEAKKQQAGPKASAVERQGVMTEEIRIEQKRKEAEILVQEKEVERKRKELEANVVLPAEAEKEAALRRADAERQSRIMRAEADRVEREQAGSGDAFKVQQVGEAEAAVAQKKLEAEAAGQEMLVKALNSYGPSGITISLARELIQRLPEMVEAASRPLAEIDRVVMIDSGGGDGPTSISRFAAIVPVQLARTLEILKETTGIDIAAILQERTSRQDEGNARAEEKSSRAIKQAAAGDGQKQAAPERQGR